MTSVHSNQAEATLCNHILYKLMEMHPLKVTYLLLPMETHLTVPVMLLKMKHFRTRSQSLSPLYLTSRSHQDSQSD